LLLLILLLLNNTFWYQEKLAMKICIYNLIRNESEVKFSYAHNKSYLIIISYSYIFVKLYEKNRYSYLNKDD